MTRVAGIGDERLRNIGRIVVNSTTLEAEIRLLLVAFAGVPDDVQTVLAGGDSLDVQAQKLRLLVQLREPDGDRKEAILRWLGRVKTVSERRNAVVHSMWLLDEDASGDDAVATLARFGRGKFVTEQMDAQQLAAIGTELRDVYEEGGEIIKRFAGDMPRLTSPGA